MIQEKLFNNLRKRKINKTQYPSFIVTRIDHKIMSYHKFMNLNRNQKIIAYYFQKIQLEVKLNQSQIRYQEIILFEDEEFFSNVSGRREQAQKTKILYSNMTGIDRAIKQIKCNKTQRESRAKIQSDHSNDVLGKVAKKNSDYTMNSSRSHIWHKVNPASQQSSIIEKKENEQRSCLTGAIKRRIVRHEEVKMPIQQIKYESLNQFIKIKPQILE
ncbi:hypothetical protein pb186bvf_009164 [Paramecium bursaria]